MQLFGERLCIVVAVDARGALTCGDGAYFSAGAAEEEATLGSVIAGGVNLLEGDADDLGGQAEVNVTLPLPNFSAISEMVRRSAAVKTAPAQTRRPEKHSVPRLMRKPRPLTDAICSGFNMMNTPISKQNIPCNYSPFSG